MSLKKLAAGSAMSTSPGRSQRRTRRSSEECRWPTTPTTTRRRGEAPGRWVGSGLAEVGSIEYGHIVAAEHMQHLFGEGCHPVTGTALGRRFGKGSVAGFDLTFSPAKSVSTLWAVASPEVAKQIKMAHNAAVLDALDFLETHATFTREGSRGARQVETQGLIAAAFLHRDSRAGDPDLHTHVAVANKVQTRQGKWLSIYGTILHGHVVPQGAGGARESSCGRARLGTEGAGTFRRPGNAHLRFLRGTSIWSRLRAPFMASRAR